VGRRARSTVDAPSLLDTSDNFKAEVEIPQGGADGMIVTQGGRFAGYGFYLLKSKPIFTWNMVDLKRRPLQRRFCLSRLTGTSWAVPS
jgi:hypothetical protein